MNLCHHKKTQSSTANVMESYMLISMEAWSPYVHIKDLYHEWNQIKSQTTQTVKTNRFEKSTSC